MGAGLCLKHGEIAVHIQHTAVGIAKEPESGTPEAAFYFGGLYPLFNLPPRPLRLRALCGIFIGERYLRSIVQSQQAVYNPVFDFGTVEGIGKLRHRARTAVCQPFPGRRLLIINLCRRLQV